MRTQIHQIYYSDTTRAENDPGFLPLDNLVNDRPDWREYWPIREFLKTETLADDCAYGFFSPKFKQKTNLSADDVYRFIAQHDADVYLFSPFFDQSAIFLNVFEQSTLQGIAHTMEQAVRLLQPEVAPLSLVMSSLDTVYCNYFVAKPRFWREWLRLCEQLFAVAEEGTTALAQALNVDAQHLGGPAPVKVFVIERIASLMLNTRSDFKVRAFNPMNLPIAAAKMAGFGAELCRLDALKIAHAAQPHAEYLVQFSALRHSVIERLPR